MLRRLAPIIFIFALIISPFVFAAPIKADDGTLSATELLEKYTSNKSLQDFCAKRRGNLMNLETWYSGKCPKSGDSFDDITGEGVGFSDIILLDLAERVLGKKEPDKSFVEIITEFGGLLSNTENVSFEEKQLAILSARQKLFSSQQSGLLEGSGKMVSYLFQTQPASTYSYLANVSQNLQKHQIIPSALAAPEGTGFNTFSAFLPLWSAVRNVAYLGLVVFFVVYGFMMMFRVNLGQKTVISVQLAIPKLITTLLIITFSYAIVGLIIDLMWVIIYFSINLLASPGINIITVGKLAPKIAAGVDYGFFGSVLLNIFISIPATIYGVISLIVGGGSFGIITFIMTTLGGIFALSGVGGPASGAALIVGLIIGISVIIAYGKLFFKLLGAFVSLTISLITSPIVLLGNALPGSDAIGTWLRGIFANAMVFPISMLFLLFSYILMVQPLLSIPVIGPILSPVLGVKSLVGDNASLSMPLVRPVATSNFDASGILALLGVSLLFMASKYVDMVRDALKVPAFKYGSAITDALKSGSSLNDKWAGTGYKKVPGRMGDNMAQAYRPTNPGDQPTWKGVSTKDGGNGVNNTNLLNGK